MLLTNGRIYLWMRGTPWPTHSSCEMDVSHSSGAGSDVNARRAEDVLDLGGRAVLPGLVDAHGHLMYLARGR